MARFFEVQSKEGKDELQTIIDLDKVCMVRVETQTGHHYPHLLVQFVGGPDSRNVVPSEAATQFLDAYRAHLKSQDRIDSPNTVGNV